MTLSLTGYFGALGILILVHAPLLYQHRKKWQDAVDDLGADIRAFNARNGYGLQVGQIDLARAYAVPYRGGSLSRFADANGISVESYESELNENVGRPIVPLGGYAYQAVATLYTLSGFSYLIPGGSISPENFLILSAVLFVLSLGVYLLT